ncbi:glycoside hydrolase family 5 protein [Erythrobacter insulae]|uniref:Glycoside hydrolase family 5 protein n=2 Tax=Erythrobacter insulae TaxID=2584124 RepID=A0A547PEY5_9SPHN|nr:glycoside hydrolase family 5 protein [Erythrobacter insulae]
MGNSLEPETENAWGGKRISAADFERIRAAGFDTIRLPVRWHTKSQNEPPYTVDAAYIKRVEQVVDWALEADLNVILNSHHFDPIYEDPKGTSAWHGGVWKQIAARFADRPESRLWFELENEPHKNFDDSNLLETLAPALAAVRATNPTRAVIIGGQEWSGIDSLATLKLPDDANIHPTFHYYSPFDFTHQGASWTGDAMPPVGRQYGAPGDAKLLEQDVAKLRAYIDRTGHTPFMGETGAYEAHIPLAQRVQYHAAVTKAFAPTGIGICVWAYTNTYPFWDQGTRRWLPGMLGAIGLPDDSVAPQPAAQPASQSNTGPLINPDLPEALRGIDNQLAGALMNDPSRLDWETYGDQFKVHGYSDASIPGGQAALAFTVKEARENFSVGASIPLLGDIKQGDTMTVGFFARAIKADTADGKARIGVRFQQNSAPYPGFGDTTVSPDSEWGWYEVTATANRDISKQLAIVSLQFGEAKQTVEVGQTIVVKGSSSIVD